MSACNDESSKLNCKNVYPTEIIPSAPSEDLRTMNSIIDKEIDKEKMKFISDKIKMIEKDLHHYMKLRKRWKIFKTISKIGSFVIFGVTEIGSGILIFVPVAGIVVPIIISASGAIELLAEQGLDKLIEKRTKNMDCKIIKCRSVLDKLFVFLEEAKKDKIIDSGELEIFNKIIDEYYLDNKKETVNNDKEDLKKLKKEVERLLKKN